MTAVVALGGGNGLSVTLRALRRYADDITAVVSVADDGGSSGRLRQAFGIPAPGDLRRALGALAADDDGVWARSFEHRFTDGDLDGHPLGNLVIAGLAAATGDFPAALEEAGRLVGAVGHVVPATAEPVVLVAEAETGSVAGEAAVGGAGRISAVGLVPRDAPSPKAAVEAILGADQVVLGPGSLFTSVLAAALPAQVRSALRETTARRIYVCNVASGEPEALGFSVADHVGALVAHGVPIDVVLADEGALEPGEPDVPVVFRRLVVDAGHHDVERLAGALSDLLGWPA